MAHRNNDNKLDTVMELLIENGFVRKTSYPYRFFSSP